jgi:hypothetical protein
MLPSYPGINVEVHQLYDWHDYEAFLKHVLANAGPDDWVIIDFIGSAWSAVQQAYVEEVFHQDLASYFLQTRKEMAKGDRTLSAFDGWVDWSVINPMYNRWVRPLLFKGKYHVYATAQADMLSSDRKPTEDTNTRSLLLPYGYKPKGQKDLLYQFHTVLLTGYEQRAGTYMVNTIKDRERAVLSAHVITSFTMKYLVEVAGWKLV